MKEIKIEDIYGISIGQVENKEAATGCTVFIAKDGMTAGMDVRGGGPASREGQLLDPLTAEHLINGIVFAGGSAFGLGTADGVMKCLEERCIGYDVSVTKVPLIVQSNIFDLGIGDTFVRPDASMGYEAARLALDSPNYRDGIYGVGCGATVGKIRGIETCVKSGIGSHAVQIDSLQIGAVVVVNAFGDVMDWRTGEQIAGPRNRESVEGSDSNVYGERFLSTLDLMQSSISIQENKFKRKRYVDKKELQNTTLAVIITNGKFGKTELCKIAGMGHNGYAKSISPVHTSADGDTIYAVSVGDVQADRDLVGAVAAEVISEAIRKALVSAESLCGIPAVSEL